jgi:hypothetical protein
MGKPSVAQRLAQAIEASPYNVKSFAAEMEKRLPRGATYSNVRRYLDESEKWEHLTPSHQFMESAADVLGVSPTWLMRGRGGILPDRDLKEVLNASEGELDQAAAAWADILSRVFTDSTPTERQLFRSVLARWLKSDPLDRLEDRIARMKRLAEMMESPRQEFGAELDARRQTDFRLAMLHALSVAMRERGAD